MCFFAASFIFIQCNRVYLFGQFINGMEMQILMAVCGNLQWHHQNFRNLLILGRQIKWDFVWMRSNIVFASQFEFVLYCSRSLCLSLSLSEHACSGFKPDMCLCHKPNKSTWTPLPQIKTKPNQTKQEAETKQNKAWCGPMLSLSLSSISLSSGFLWF